MVILIIKSLRQYFYTNKNADYQLASCAELSMRYTINVITFTYSK